MRQSPIGWLTALYLVLDRGERWKVILRNGRIGRNVLVKGRQAMKFEPSTRFTIIYVTTAAFILGLVWLGQGDFAREAWRDIWGVF